MTRLQKWLSGSGAVIAALAVSFAAHAQEAFFTVPTSTAPTLTANVGAQIADVGTLAVVALAAGIPLVFYVIHQLIGLLPKSRSRRN